MTNLVHHIPCNKLGTTLGTFEAVLRIKAVSGPQQESLFMEGIEILLYHISSRVYGRTGDSP